MPICAYCKEDRATTREHVIPAFMYAIQRAFGEGIVGWNEVAQRMVGGEAKVKDVCANCNNTVLSDLDAYGKRLLGDSGLLVHNYQKKTLTLSYEYSQLLRWLLKISFNSSRTDGAHSYLFEDLIPFILGKSGPPLRHKVALLAYLASPIALDKLGEAVFHNAARGAKTFNPFLTRICYGYVPGNDSLTLRINIFGPLVFYMPIFNEGTLPGHAAAATRRILKLTPGAVELTATRRLVELKAGPKSWLDLYGHQIRRTAHSSTGRNRS